jgi:hypothetical protein
MKVRRVFLVPPVLLATGCASRPTTPAASAGDWAPAPDVSEIALSARDTTLRRWQLPPSDPWGPYAKYTLLSALDPAPQQVELPDVTTLADVQRAGIAGRQIAANGIPPNTMFIVDVRGAASVAFGVALSTASRQSVSLVPTFNNWPGQDELVPAEETLAALATMSPRQPQDDEGITTPVFMLDAWRLAYRYEDPGEDTYDNRYILTTGDLPDTDTLRARGIERVVYVVSSLDETQFEEDDVHRTFFEWQYGGIPIAMVDLDRLEQPIPLDRWPAVFNEYALTVVPRRTILDDPRFYVLARGGFGGIHARPSPIYAGGSWTSAGGYTGHGGWGWGGGGG